LSSDFGESTPKANIAPFQLFGQCFCGAVAVAGNMAFGNARTTDAMLNGASGGGGSADGGGGPR
jgi:putative exporter of polyketide antibiotics